MPNIGSVHVNEAKKHDLHGFYHANRGDWGNALPEYMDSVNEMDRIPDEELTDEDRWLQSRNYLRLARGFHEIGATGLEEDACFMAINWLWKTKHVQQNQAGVYAEIYKRLKDLHLKDRYTLEYELFSLAEMIFSQPDFNPKDKFEQIRKQLLDLNTTNQRLVTFGIQFLGLMFDSSFNKILPNKLLIDNFTDPKKLQSMDKEALAVFVTKEKKYHLELDNVIGLLSLLKNPLRREVIQQMCPSHKRKHMRDDAESMRNLTTAGMMTRSKAQKLAAEVKATELSDTIGLQPKRPAA